ncbi:F0F1 ATP synthase subunit epsilon [Candidatus Desulfovibrio trichonymphae]|uniref:ATP synthase epsilon chain n=1 Tax=Candidatus Desulfovibrio trichonymphae TaxID=1725232 RepID=A0A1J1DV55_9BACT|nr:F0F1 ATP synthase subunit epsilon [Candidatus Desulfovibrio trichonymphae]BAV91684.1 F0F1 ATP synthase subunit epsilon [Candidatus Desulfovibrio trichonymphae]GHU91185.1 ATP synthase epsilon chain [Deltaproteobacteria bacterium]GHU94851.1 ATP synthase epsilon chain [Deltaproteobacteria bacterium]GHU99997.1 ATP synthase epsilon chain [Deltaproteobacteria bacterium]
MGTLQLEVVTPDKIVVSAEAEMVVCPGVAGEFGVLPQHVSLLSALKIGGMRYRVNGKDATIFISGGFADVNNNVMTVLAESAEQASDIDAVRAQAARERAEKRLAARDEVVEAPRAEAALQRAIMRLNIAGLR